MFGSDCRLSTKTSFTRKERGKRKAEEETHEERRFFPDSFTSKKNGEIAFWESISRLITKI